jgi:CheY-like chemotaxis protein/predicted regulator of Ras-like GTPase activity (Roadblock/LC7/MglB family)
LNESLARFARLFFFDFLSQNRYNYLSQQGIWWIAVPRTQLGGGRTVAEQRILIVDGNESFATMLKEELESFGAYQAIVTTRGTEALDVLGGDQVDLAIVDMGLEDMDGPTLVQSLRQSRPGLRIVLIPIFGQELAEEERALEVQGILPKPFFVGDLPDLIQEALTRPWETEPEPAAEMLIEAAPDPDPEPLPASKATARERFTARDVDGLLEELFREIRAEAVIFTRDAELIAHAGNVTRQRAQELTGLTAKSLNAAHKIAAFLGEPADCFEQCTLEGSEYSVYSLSVASDAVLSVALSARTPVGIVRYNLRRTADALTQVWHE